MRTRNALIAGAAVAAVALIPGGGTANAQSEGCDAAPVEAGGYYVQVRDVETGSVWVYQESNGIAGLQTGGATDLSDDTGCNMFDAEGNQIQPDTLIF